jgi:hypothetical protein
MHVFVLFDFTDTVGDSLFFRLVSMCNSTVWRECMVFYQERTLYSFKNPWWIVYTLLHTIPVWICAFILFFGVVGIDENSIAFWLAIILKLAILKTKISYRRLWSPKSVETVETVATTTNVIQPQMIQYQQAPQQQPQPQPRVVQVEVQEVTMIQMPDGQLVEAQAIQDQNGNIQYVPATQVQVQPQVQMPPMQYPQPKQAPHKNSSPQS